MTEPEPRITQGYARYVLGVLFSVSALSFIDRNVLSILIEPIKQEFGVSDTAMGLLAGPAFVLFYTLCGIPIARWSDRGVRRSIIALGVALWSLMTALSGLAQSFWQLAAIRVGVGVGEAAGGPPAHSLVSDYFPPHQRGRALSILALGIQAGIAFGVFAGAWLQEFFGWRWAFVAVGLPGLAVAALVRFSVRELPRGYSDAQARESEQEHSTADAFRYLGSLPSFRGILIAQSFIGVAGYGIAVWAPTFLVRVHGMGYGEVGTWIGFSTLLGATIGTYGGGALGDRLGAVDARRYLYVAAAAPILGAPLGLFFAASSQQTAALLCYAPFILAVALHSGPTFAMLQALAPPGMRAMSTAIMMFVANLIGMGAGPLVVGALNDLLAPHYGQDAIRFTLMFVVSLNVFAGLFFWLAARTLREDLQRTARYTQTA